MSSQVPYSLDNLHIASPCHASWDAMSGDDKARFCKTCRKNVFNLSVMSRAEAEALILEKESDLCVRFARREDGTIISDDCPVGAQIPLLTTLWLSPRKLAAAALAILAAMLGNAWPSSAKSKTHRHRRTPVAHRAKKTKSKETHVISTGLVIMVPTPTPMPRPITIIRGVESQTASSPESHAKVITVAPFKK